MSTRKKTLIGLILVSMLSLFGCGRNTDLPQAGDDEPALIEEISITGFDPEGEPVIKKWSDGSLWIQFEAMPPYFAEDEGTEAAFENFDSVMQDAIGVAVRRDDREVFVITSPQPDTATKAKAWLESYRDGGS